MSAQVRVTVKIDVSDDLIESIVEGASYSTHWIADLENNEERRYVVVTPSREVEERQRTVTYQQLGYALANIVDGIITVREDIRDHARTALFEDDGGEVDSEVGDAVLQAACFGKLVFG